MNQRLTHDSAMAMTRMLLDLVSSCMREEEHRDAFKEF